jgi:hypothetical protein
MKGKYMVVAAVLMTVLAVSLIVVYTFQDTLFQEPKKTTVEVIMDISPVDAGTITPERGTYFDTYQRNTNLTITAEAKSGYTFAYWEISTVSAVLERPTESTYTLQLTEDEYILTAFFTLPPQQSNSTQPSNSTG